MTREKFIAYLLIHGWGNKISSHDDNVQIFFSTNPQFDGRGITIGVYNNAFDVFEGSYSTHNTKIHPAQPFNKGITTLQSLYQEYDNE